MMLLFAPRLLLQLIKARFIRMRFVCLALVMLFTSLYHLNRLMILFIISFSLKFAVTFLSLIRLNKSQYLRRCIEGVAVSVSDSDVLEFSRYMHARSARQSRLALRLYMMIRDNDYVYFCTQTFSDEYLLSVSDIYSTVRKRFQRSGLIDYVYNYDFGEKNGRLHFHAVVASSLPLSCDEGVSLFPDMGEGLNKRLDWFDIIDNQRIGIISNYVSKHAIKDSAAARSHYKRGVYTDLDYQASRTEYIRMRADFNPSDCNLRALYIHENHINPFESISPSCKTEHEKAISVLNRYNITLVDV